MQGSELGWSMIWRSRLVRRARGVDNNRSAEVNRPFGASLLGGCADEDETNTNLRRARLPKRIVDDFGADRQSASAGGRGARSGLSTTSGQIVVAAVFCLVFLVMGAAFSFSTFASELGRDLNAGSGSISFIFGCAMALLYAGGLFSGALADRIGTHRVAGAGALIAGGSLIAASAVNTVWKADVTLGAGFGLGLAICYTPAVAAVQPWFDRNRGVASGIALSGTGLGTLVMPMIARWLIDEEGWRIALILIGLGVAGPRGAGVTPGLTRRGRTGQEGPTAPNSPASKPHSWRSCSSSLASSRPATARTLAATSAWKRWRASVSVGSNSASR